MIDFESSIFDPGSAPHRKRRYKRLRDSLRLQFPQCKCLPGIFLAFVFSTSIADALFADVVHRRGGLPSLEGQITKFDDGGITIKRPELTEPDFVRWDYVRDAEMNRPDPLLDQYKETAANLWRARARLERNDATLAEPLFERLFEKYRGKTNEAAMVVAEGLLRCRLARGLNDAAIIPALETIRLKRALRQASAYSGLPAVIDEGTQLCTMLPPAWVNSAYLARVDRDLAAYEAGTDTVVAAMAYLYRQAIAQQLAIRFHEGERVLAADHPGVALLRQMVELQSSQEARRNAAQQIIMRDMPSLPVWAQAWSHYFFGLSMMQTDVAQMQRGQVMISHVPARFASVQPYLAGLSVARLIEHAESAGDQAAATSLRQELAARFPYHPVIQTLDSQKRRNVAASDVFNKQSHTPTRTEPS